MKTNKFVIFILLFLSSYIYAGDNPVPDGAPVDVAFNEQPSGGGNIGPPPPPPSPIGGDVTFLIFFSIVFGLVVCYSRSEKSSC